jgi:hypothetical protein
MTTKDMIISIVIIKKRKLTIKKLLKRLRNDKSRVFALYSVFQRRVTREKNAINNKKISGFYATRLA